MAVLAGVDRKVRDGAQSRHNCLCSSLFYPVSPVSQNRRLRRRVIELKIKKDMSERTAM